MADAKVAAHLSAGEQSVQASLGTARDLLGAGFPSPSFVWSIRSVEIFLKRFVLTPLYFLDLDDWTAATKKAGSKFGSSNWLPAMNEVERMCGPLDLMLMEGDADAYRYWQNKPVRIRGDVLHGKVEASAGEAEYALAFAEQMISQLKTRLLSQGAHPLRGALVADLRSAFEAAGLADPSDSDVPGGHYPVDKPENRGKKRA